MVLWIPTFRSAFSTTGLSPSSATVIHRCSSNTSQNYAGPQPQASVDTWFGLFPFRSPLLRKSIFFLFLRVLRCFSSPRFLILRYFIHTAVPAHYYRWVPPFGNLRFITDICSLPQLIAACHVLRRLLVPRHPPYALFNLTSCLSFSPSASLPSLASVLTYLCTLRSSLLQRLAVREKSFAVLINFLLC